MRCVPMWTRRSVAVLSLPVVLVGATITPANAGHAARRAQPPECRVVNVTRASAATANLQAAIDAARRRDTLRVKGTCHGGFVVDKSLTLTGPAGRDRPTLGGSHSERVLTIQGSKDHWIRVTVRNLRIARGHVRGYGGGMRSAYADVRLVNTLVWKNEAGRGGGIYSRGALKLVDSRAARNDAKSAGGIFARGSLVMVGHSRVEWNEAGWSAGISSPGSVTLRGRTRVRWNEAGGAAGMSIHDAPLHMSGHASVVGNVSSGSFGGIYAGPGSRIRLKGHSSVRRNVAARNGGGAFCAGSMSMFDHSRVTGNVSARSAGGIQVYERLRLHDDATVGRNLAQRAGGVFVLGGELTLSERASIVQNRAGIVGGGVLVWTTHRSPIGVKDRAVIAHNDPQNVVIRSGHVGPPS